MVFQVFGHRSNVKLKELQNYTFIFVILQYEYSIVKYSHDFFLQYSKAYYTRT